MGKTFSNPERTYFSLVTRQIRIFWNYKSEHQRFLLNVMHSPVISRVSYCCFRKLALWNDFCHFKGKSCFEPWRQLSAFSCLESALARRSTWWDRPRLKSWLCHGDLGGAIRGVHSPSRDFAEKWGSMGEHHHGAWQQIAGLQWLFLLLPVSTPSRKCVGNNDVPFLCFRMCSWGKTVALVFWRRHITWLALDPGMCDALCLMHVAGVQRLCASE